MNRRDFNATVSGLVLSWWLPKSAQRVRHIDLSAFCGQGRRYTIDRPFQQDALSYATDERICVRTALPVDLGENPESAKLPPANALPWWNHDQQTGWRNWRTARPVTNGCPLECPDCEGSGRSGSSGIVMCLLCGGNGVRLIGNDYEAQCECKTGWVGGSACPPSKTFSGISPAPSHRGGVFIAPKYHAKVLALGDVQFALTATSVLDNGRPIVLFRGDSVDGVLCPLQGG